MIDETIDGLGGLDGLVLNVGTFGQTGLRTFDLAEWDNILNTNLRGPMLCCRHALDCMADDSSIVFISSVAAKKAPDSPVAGQATVFVFPDLNTGNTTYKAVQRSANVISVGPMLQGISKPVNDLSRGALVDDIVYTIALTAIQAANP